MKSDLELFPINSGGQGKPEPPSEGRLPLTTTVPDHATVDVEPLTESTDGSPLRLPIYEFWLSHKMLTARQLVFALWGMGLPTLVMDVSTLLYKPARGVVFGHNRLAYYLTLGGILASGVAEVLTAFWLSRSGEDDGRCRFKFGRAVLCTSVVPFVAIVAIGGFTFIDGHWKI